MSNRKKTKKKPKIIISSFSNSPKKISSPKEFVPSHLQKKQLSIPLREDKNFYPSFYIRKEDLTKTDCGLVYSLYKKGTKKIKGFIIGEKHYPVMECQVIQLQKFIDFADIIFTEYNMKKYMMGRNSVIKHNDLLVLSNLLKFSHVFDSLMTLTYSIATIFLSEKILFCKTYR